MRAFTFSLENLLQVRIRAQEQVERRLAQKNREIEEARSDILNLQNKLKQFLHQAKEKRKAGEDIHSMRQSVTYRNRLKLDMLKNGQQLNELAAQAHLIRKDLVKATQEKKAVEVLKEKRYREWLKMYNKHEQKQLDEMSTQGYIRKRSRGEVL